MLALMSNYLFGSKEGEPHFFISIIFVYCFVIVYIPACIIVTSLRDCLGTSLLSRMNAMHPDCRNYFKGSARAQP
jgi:hypothetical protein